MKYLLWLLKHFIPRQEGDAPPGDPPPSDPPPGDPPAGDPPAPPGGSDPEGRPDWLPEKFWNPELKAPRPQQMAKSINELEGKLRSKHEDLKAEVITEMRANAPESYEVNLSEDLKIPENVELDLTAEDPLVGWFFDFAKERGLSQEEVDSAINKYVEIELANMPDVAKEIENLGDYGQDRLLRVHNWLETSLSDEHFAALNPLLSSSAQIEALETLMKNSTPTDFDGDPPTPAMTLEELREMQNDPKYWREKEPAFIQKVEAGYKRLYKNQ
jgi:hypothetical protein